MDSTDTENTEYYSTFFSGERYRGTCPFMATFVQGYCHLLFLSLACLQFKYLKEDGSNLTMLMKWVTLMVGLSKAALSSSAGQELVKVQVADE